MIHIFLAIFQWFAVLLFVSLFVAAIWISLINGRRD